MTTPKVERLTEFLRKQSLDYCSRIGLTERDGALAPPKVMLRNLERQIPDALRYLHIPFVPDAANSGDFDPQGYQEYLGVYDDVLADKPIIVYPHFRGTLLSGRRVTEFLASPRSPSERRPVEREAFTRFLELLARVLTEIYGLPRTMSECVALLSDIPGSDLNSALDIRRIPAGVLLDMRDEKVLLADENNGKVLLVRMSLGEHLRGLLLRNGELADAVGEAVRSEFNATGGRVDLDHKAKSIASALKEGRHNLVQELAQTRRLVSAQLAEASGAGFPDEERRCIRRMCCFLASGNYLSQRGLPDECHNNREVDAALAVLQASLVYFHPGLADCASVGVFVVPSERRLGEPVWPRCSTTCAWPSSPKTESAAAYCHLVEATYQPFRDQIEVYLTAAERSEKNRVDTNGLGNWLLGEDVASTFSTSLESAGTGLLKPYYLLAIMLGRELAARAKHEGEILKFSLLLGREHHLQTLLPVLYEIPTEDRKNLRVSLSSLRNLRTPKPDNALGGLMARILGHYAIFSKPYVGLFATCDTDEGEESITITHVVSLLGIHALPLESKSEGTAERHPDFEPIKRIAEARPEVLGLVASGDSRIRVFHGGREVLTAVNGKWAHTGSGLQGFTEKLRVFLEEHLAPHSWTKLDFDVLASTIERIYSKAGKGAAFVVCDYDVLSPDASGAVDTKRLAVPATKLLGYVEGRSIQELGNADLLEAVAEMDGATLIDRASTKVYGRRQLPAFDWSHDDNDYRAKWESAELRWTAWPRVYSWGIRHLSALGVTANSAANAVSVVLSADGPISVFKGGRGVDGLTFPD